jgi:hypothetical protein
MILTNQTLLLPILSCLACANRNRPAQQLTRDAWLLNQAVLHTWGECFYPNFWDQFVFHVAPGMSGRILSVLEQTMVLAFTEICFCSILKHFKGGQTEQATFINSSMALQPFIGPWPLLQFRNFFTQTLGLLGRVIRPSQRRYLHTGQHKHRTNAHTDIHALTGIRTHDPSVRASWQFMP